MGHYEGLLLDPAGESPKRLPRNRKRHLAILWGLRKIGALASIEEANEFIGLAELGFEGLSAPEYEVIFGQKYPPTSSHSTPVAAEEVVIPAAIAETHNENDPRTKAGLSSDAGERSKLPLRLSVVGLFAVVAAATVFWFWLRPDGASPWFYDDFSSPTVNAEAWIYPATSRLYTNDGKLLFNFLFDPSQYASDDPSSDDWQEQVLEHRQVSESFHFSHIKFSAALTTPQESSSGAFGVQTHCDGENRAENRGYLTVYLGGEGRRLAATYAYDIAATAADERVVDLMGLETGKLYTIDLAWTERGVDITVDGEKKTAEPIPCPPPLYFNINGGVARDLIALEGYIDEIQVWD